MKAIIFDLDGTLLDTMADLAWATNTAMERLGLPARPVENYREYIGYGATNMMRSACPEGTSEETVQAVLAEYLKCYPEHCTVDTAFYPGIPELLDTLAGKGYTLGIISNKDEFLVQKVADHYLQPWDFKILWGNNGTRPIKPALDAGYLVCETLGMEPKDIVFVGDGDTDIQFGTAMGFNTIGCTWGYRDGAILKKLGAHHLVDVPQEIETLL